MRPWVVGWAAAGALVVCLCTRGAVAAGDTSSVAPTRRLPAPPPPQAEVAAPAAHLTTFRAEFRASPTGPHAPAAWQQDVVYQVFPRSFVDSDDDGIGDLRGVLEKVDYLHDLGVNVVWLNPIFASSHFDSGYDVSDYLTIDPVYGTLEDWYALRDALHARRMRLMMDLVLNHTSDAHPWFQQEIRRKALHHRLAKMAQAAPRQEGEALLDMLSDPDFSVPPKTPALRAARADIESFLARDGRQATDAGYPSPAAQLTAMARALTPCVSHRQSCQEVTQPFDDFYIWRAKANNWTSLFSGSAWHPVEGTGGSVMSLFSVHQVDLNWRNPDLRRAMKNIIQVWRARGLDGLRIDSTGTLRKNPLFPDAPDKPVTDVRGIKFFTNLPEVHGYLREMAEAYGPDFRTIGEVAFNRPEAPLDYAGVDRKELNEVFVFDHIAIDCNGSKWRAKAFDVKKFKEIIGQQQGLIHGRAWLGNYLENHDQLRIISRYGDDQAYRTPSAKLFATLLMTLEGTPYIYQGQEIGMTNLDANVFHRVEDIGDIEARNYYYAQVKGGASATETFRQIATRCRDNVRSSMQWSAAPFGGFSGHPPEVWVNDNYRTINVEESLKDKGSILHTYKRLIGLRHLYPSWTFGTFRDELPDDDKVFAYTRTYGGETSLVLLNISGERRQFTLPPTALPLHAKEPLVTNLAPPAAPLSTTVSLLPWEARIYVGGTQGHGGSAEAWRP